MGVHTSHRITKLSTATVGDSDALSAVAAGVFTARVGMREWPLSTFQQIHFLVLPVVYDV